MKNKTKENWTENVLLVWYVESIVSFNKCWDVSFTCVYLYEHGNHGMQPEKSKYDKSKIQSNFPCIFNDGWPEF